MEFFQRKFSSIDTGINSIQNSLKIMTYNILAPSNIDYFFPKHTDDMLNWENRMKLIKKEIDIIKPNICFMQEVEQDDVNNWEEYFKQYNMSCLFKKKQKETKSDGNMICYNHDQFQKKNYWHFNCFFENGKNYNQSDLLEKEMWYPTSVQILLLQQKLSKRNIICINSHLPFNQNRGHVKLAIYVCILKILKSFEAYYQFDYVVWAGDFNTVPNSMMYTLITQQKVNLIAHLREYSNTKFVEALKKKGSKYTFIQRLADQIWKKPYGNFVKPNLIKIDFLNQLCSLKVIIEHEEIRFENDQIKKRNLLECKYYIEELAQQRQFQSAYSQFNKQYKKNKQQNKNSNQEIEFSHYTLGIIAPVDYIFICGQQYDVCKILDPPNINLMQKSKINIPFGPYASDHISLACQILIDQLINKNYQQKILKNLLIKLKQEDRKKNKKVFYQI